jgi:molybdenum cofactor cytidylyltransferase
MSQDGPDNFAALVLAAGLSRRSGTTNKLLATVDGRPMVRAVAETVLEAGFRPVLAVTGHEREKVRAALGGLDVGFAHNPDYAEGMASSIRHGVAALDDDVAGVLIALGDMPWVAAETLVALAGAFDAASRLDICRPVHAGKPGNPVLFGRRHFAALMALTGDVGAKGVIAANPDSVVDVPVDDTGVQRDLDVVGPEAD